LWEISISDLEVLNAQPIVEEKAALIEEVTAKEESITSEAPVDLKIYAAIKSPLRRINIVLNI